MDIDNLPSYVMADCCENRHFLTIHRDIKGLWCIAYVEAEEHSAIGGLARNDSTTLKEAATRMDAALKRWKKRGSGTIAL